MLGLGLALLCVRELPFIRDAAAGADRADGRHAGRRRHRLPADLRLGRGPLRLALGPRRRRLGRHPRQRARRLLGPRRAGRLGVDAADLPDPAGRPAVAAAGAVRGRARRRRGHLADVRRSHAADAGAGAGGRDRAAHDRRVHDVRPGLRAHPRRPGHVDAADLDLRLRHVLPLPAVRLRRGDAADGGAGRPGRSRSWRCGSCAGRRRRREGSAHHSRSSRSRDRRARRRSSG